MADRILVEFLKPGHGTKTDRDAYSWVQCVETRSTHRKLMGRVQHGLKTWVESTLKVQISRRPEYRGSTFITEYHHQSYNGPWCRGRDIADYLIHRGLRPSHYLLDFGCGCIRAGIWLIEYLDDGHYFGLDAHLQSLEAAVEYEIPLHNLEGKHPRFLQTKTFDLDYFQQTFDIILANSVLHHLSESQLDTALRNVASSLSPSGRLVLTPGLPHDKAALASKYKFELTHVEKRRSKFSDADIEWFELTPSRA